MVIRAITNGGGGSVIPPEEVNGYGYGNGIGVATYIYSNGAFTPQNAPYTGEYLKTTSVDANTIGIDAVKAMDYVVLKRDTGVPSATIVSATANQRLVTLTRSGNMVVSVYPKTS